MNKLIDTRLPFRPHAVARSFPAETHARKYRRGVYETNAQNPDPCPARSSDSAGALVSAATNPKAFLPRLAHGRRDIFQSPNPKDPGLWPKKNQDVMAGLNCDWTTAIIEAAKSPVNQR
jgi:hypothetical protein